MFEIENLKNYITEEILTTLFNAREDEIVETHNKQEKFYSEISKTHPTTYQKLITSVEKLESKQAKKIKSLIEDYVERENIIREYENEKFYKVGFADGFRTIEENLSKEEITDRVKLKKMKEDYSIPYYIFEEIVEYVELTAKGHSKCMKWKNIKTLLNIAVINKRITQEQADFLEKEFNRENKKSI